MVLNLLSFFNFWADHPHFLHWVEEGWSSEVVGYAMFQLYAKLKSVKRVLKAKNLEVFGGLGQRVLKARQDLAFAQSDFIMSHGNVDCHLREQVCLHALVSIYTAEEKFLNQKARINWLKLGDGNNAFFHKVVKARNSFNLIKVLHDESGNRVVDMKGIKDLAIGFYQNLLGSSDHVFTSDKAARLSSLFRKKFSSSCIAGMQAGVTREEIQKVIFSMNKSKAPGPDGFSAAFFHNAWPVVGDSVCEAVLNFFSAGKLLRKLMLLF
jgi:hypothetical protein